MSAVFAVRDESAPVSDAGKIAAPLRTDVEGPGSAFGSVLGAALTLSCCNVRRSPSNATHPLLPIVDPGAVRREVSRSGVAACHCGVRSNCGRLLSSCDVKADR
jgi:hypothetical protein